MAFCFNCMGKGYVECPECNGTGEQFSYHFKGLEKLDNRCSECGGSGRVICDECDGSGYEDDDDY